MAKLLDWDARCVATSDTRAHPQNCITLDEHQNDQTHPSYRCVPNIIEEIPVFTEWVEKHLNGNMTLPRNFYLSKQWHLLEE